MRRILPSRELEVLAVVMGIVGRAAVAEGDVEIAVRAEADGAAVVVPERLLDAQQSPPRKPDRPGWDRPC